MPPLYRIVSGLASESGCGWGLGVALTKVKAMRMMANFTFEEKNKNYALLYKLRGYEEKMKTIKSK